MNVLEVKANLFKGAAPALLPPANAVVRRLFTGTNVVKWRHSRKGGARFIVEARSEADQDWTELAVVDGLKYNHMDGQQWGGIVYRVRTLQGAEHSAPTPEIVVPSDIVWPNNRPSARVYGLSLGIAGTR